MREGPMKYIDVKGKFYVPPEAPFFCLFTQAMEVINSFQLC